MSAADKVAGAQSVYQVLTNGVIDRLATDHANTVGHVPGIHLISGDQKGWDPTAVRIGMLYDQAAEDVSWSLRSQ